ncbi:hypothetical protein Pmani_007536 [Petrolisthes manimaculis]|uniref:Uncharacterized protein n=1 Tax=Petrolisthes manimaculis TaxID=1843537 RepID=A0AAE1Q7H9_9EUCA|nr:hypothetical protein Pmani_007536 [Petrolisthes manimaculis]
MSSSGISPGYRKEVIDQGIGGVDGPNDEDDLLVLVVNVGSRSQESAPHYTTTHRQTHCSDPAEPATGAPTGPLHITLVVDASSSSSSS